jgi:GAF domain-containing protein/sugar diacid utilization regulator
VTVSKVPPSLRPWMSAVSEIARAVNAAQPLEEVLDRVAAYACELIGFEFCAVMLADEQRQRLHIAGCNGLTPHYLAQVSGGRSLQIHPPGAALDTPAARAYREDRTIVVPDVRDASSYGLMQDLAPSQGYRALLAAPLRGSGERAGVLVAYSVRARGFGPPELELIELLAGQAALALETTRLRAGQQQVIGELSRANAELRRGRAVLEWAEQQHHQLMQLVLDEVELPGLVAALAATLRASVTVEDADGRVLARAPEQGYQPPPEPAARRSGGRYQVARVRGPGGVVAWAAPVVLGRELAGRLWVTAPAAEPEPVQLRVIERFALVVALLLLQQRHLLDAQSRLSGDLLVDLLREGGPAHPQAVLDRAAALGHDLSRPHVVALLAVDGVVPPAVRLPEVVRAAAEPGPVPLLGSYDGLQVLLQLADPDPGDALRRILAKTTQAVGTHGVVTMVTGPLTRDPSGYATAFRVARGALALHLGGGTGGGFVDAGALGLPALLLEVGAPDTLRRFSARLLEPIETHEQRHGGDLIATLRAWLAAGCSTATAAQSLVVHRNTVTSRLSRTEQLTGRRLADSSTRLELQMALMIRDITKLSPDRRHP